MLNIFVCHQRHGLKGRSGHSPHFYWPPIQGSISEMGSQRQAQWTDAHKAFLLCVTRKEKQVRPGQSSRHFCKRLNTVFSFFHPLSCWITVFGLISFNTMFDGQVWFITVARPVLSWMGRGQGRRVSLQYRTAQRLDGLLSVPFGGNAGVRLPPTGHKGKGLKKQNRCLAKLLKGTRDLPGLLVHLSPNEHDCRGDPLCVI